MTQIVISVISRLFKECFIIWFSEPGETRPTNGRSLDGAVVAEIADWITFLLLLYNFMIPL